MKNKYDYWSGKFREKSSHWQGGKHVAWNGYVRILKRDHPRALSNGYVWEHILVAEQTVGRPLKYYKKSDRRNETVHHINGIKTDNSPENLMILVGPKHSKLEWDENPLKYPQSHQTRAADPKRYDAWYKANKRHKNKDRRD
jgi:hypothetical protein